MNFYHMPTAYNLSKKLYAKLRIPFKDTPDEFYTSAKDRYIDFRKHSEVIGHNQLVCEQNWHREGKPYYNMHPRMTAAFSRSRLDFPCKYIKLPYDTLEINFEENDPTLLVNGVRLRSCFVDYTDKELSWEENENGFYNPKFIKNQRLTIWMDLGERSYDADADIEEAIITYRLFKWNEDTTTVEQALNALAPDPTINKGQPVPTELVDTCIKLVVSLCFLAADDSPLIIPDIIRKDFPTYIKTADPKARQKIAENSWKTRGSKGYLVGIDEVQDLGFFPYNISESSNRKSEGFSISWQQIVSGHWKLVHYGEKKQFARMRWIVPYVRGKDLPFKPVENS